MSENDKSFEGMNIYEFMKASRQFKKILESNTPESAVYEVMYKHYIPLISETNVTVEWENGESNYEDIVNFGKALAKKERDLEEIFKIMFGTVSFMDDEN